MQDLPQPNARLDIDTALLTIDQKLQRIDLQVQS